MAWSPAAPSTPPDTLLLVPAPVPSPTDLRQHAVPRAATANASPFFRALLCGPFLERGTASVELPFRGGVLAAVARYLCDPSADPSRLVAAPHAHDSKNEGENGDPGGGGAAAALALIAQLLELASAADYCAMDALLAATHAAVATAIADEPAVACALLSVCVAAAMTTTAGDARTAARPAHDVLVLTLWSSVVTALEAPSALHGAACADGRVQAFVDLSPCALAALAAAFARRREDAYSAGRGHASEWRVTHLKLEELCHSIDMECVGGPRCIADGFNSADVAVRRASADVAALRASADVAALRAMRAAVEAPEHLRAGDVAAALDAALVASLPAVTAAAAAADAEEEAQAQEDELSDHVERRGHMYMRAPAGSQWARAGSSVGDEDFSDRFADDMMFGDLVTVDSEDDEYDMRWYHGRDDDDDGEDSNGDDDDEGDDYAGDNDDDDDDDIDGNDAEEVNANNSEGNGNAEEVGSGLAGSVGGRVEANVEEDGNSSYLDGNDIRVQHSPDGGEGTSDSGCLCELCPDDSGEHSYDSDDPSDCSQIDLHDIVGQGDSFDDSDDSFGDVDSVFGDCHEAIQRVDEADHGEYDKNAEVFDDVDGSLDNSGRALEAFDDSDHVDCSEDSGDPFGDAHGESHDDDFGYWSMGS